MNLEKYFDSKDKIKSCKKDILCSVLTTKGKICSRKRLINSDLCKLHQGTKEKLEFYTKWLKENNPIINSAIPKFLISYTDEKIPPNQAKLIYGDKPNRAEYIKFYGSYKGHPFTEQDLIQDRINIKKILVEEQKIQISESYCPISRIIPSGINSQQLAILSQSRIKTWHSSSRTDSFLVSYAYDRAIRIRNIKF